jgi:Ca2+-binding EF-hand superfamily protein
MAIKSSNSVIFFRLDSDLDNIIEEVDEDGSGNLDFDEFMEMMA